MSRFRNGYMSQLCAPLLCDGAGDIFKKVIAGSTGGQKLAFPYELPPLQLEFTPSGKNTLLLAVGILAGGIALNGYLNYASK